MAVRLHLLVIICTLQLWASILSNHWVHASVDKIFINTTTQLYTGSTDGRVYLFHGLATEDSSPPWTLSAYNDEQIELMKALQKVYTKEIVENPLTGDRVYQSSSIIVYDLLSLPGLANTQWGLNVVRMGFQWHMVEPTTGHYNEAYIQNVVDFVERLNRHDVHVILDMHQDCWSPLYCDAHGIPAEYAQGYSNSNYKPGGSKAYPEPVTKPAYDSNGHITNCGDVGKHLPGWATCYITYAIGAAAQRLYDNDQGILDRFGMFWKMMASRVMSYPNVLGYELLNEPWLGDVPLSFEEFLPTNPHWDLWFPKVSDRKNMAKMYQTLHKYIRKVDNNTIVFFEPATGGNFLDAWPVGFDEGPGGIEYNDRQALSYHVYCPFVDTKKTTNFIQYIIANLSIGACDVLNDAMYDVRRRDAAKLKIAGFLTEFGNAGNGVAAEDTINFAAKKMDEFLHSWTYWYLTPNPSDPNSTVIQTLARPFAHKIAGVPTEMEFDPKTKKFTLQYLPCSEAPCANHPTEIYTSKNYTYSGGIAYNTQTLNTVQGYFNDTIQIWYIQVIKIVPGEPVRVSITAPKT